jgi:hypothetical protein
MSQGGVALVTARRFAVQIPVLVEPLPDGRGFRARSGEPLAMSAEGPTKDEAMRELQKLANGRLGGDAEIIPMEVKSGNPWIDLAGFLPDDDVTRRWQDILRENRRKANESPDGLLPTA